MRMFAAALVAGAVLGFVGAKILMPEVAELVTDPGTQTILGAGLVAFLGSLWGWLAKGLIAARKD